MAAFGVVVGAGYGVLTGEPAGIVLLLAFGLAAALASIAITVGSIRAPAPLTDDPADGRVGHPPEVADEPVPQPGWTPLLLGIGLGGLALGAAFGPWLLIAGLLLTLAAARGWLAAAVREASRARRR
jgi:hypothetical protein